MLFSVVVYFLSIISAFVIYCLFYRRIGLVENLFTTLRVLSESSKTCYFCIVFTRLFSTMVSVRHIYCWRIACFHCFCLNHALGCLYWIKFVKISKQKCLMSSTRTLFSVKARCFSQSDSEMPIKYVPFTWILNNE